MLLVAAALVTAACGTETTVALVPLRSAEGLHQLSEPSTEAPSLAPSRRQRAQAETSIARYYQALDPSAVQVQQAASLNDSTFVVAQVRYGARTFAAAGALVAQGHTFRVAEMVGDPSGSPLDDARPLPGSGGSVLLPLKARGATALVGFMDTEVTLVEVVESDQTISQSQEPSSSGATALVVSPDGQLRTYAEDDLLGAASISGTLQPPTEELKRDALEPANDFITQTLGRRKSTNGVTVLESIAPSLTRLLEPWTSSATVEVEGRLGDNAITYRLEGEKSPYLLKLYLRREAEEWQVWAYALNAD